MDTEIIFRRDEQQSKYYAARKYSHHEIKYSYAPVYKSYFPDTKETRLFPADPSFIILFFCEKRMSSICNIQQNQPLLESINITSIGNNFI